MANRKAWIAFFSTTLTVIAALALLSLNNDREREKKLRAEKELELQNTLLSVTEKETQIASLMKQKNELEEEFDVKIERLETSVKEHAAQVSGYEERIGTLEQENQTLKRELDTKNKKVADLLRRLETLETDKTDLLAMVKKLEADQSAVTQSGGGLESPSLESASARSPWAPRTAPDLDPVELGKIVVQHTSGRAAEVQHVNTIYGFIVVNAGFKDGVRKNQVLNIVRDNKMVGKAVVRQIRNDVAAAAVLPEWTQGEIRVGDVISRF